MFTFLTGEKADKRAFYLLQKAAAKHSRKRAIAVIAIRVFYLFLSLVMLYALTTLLDLLIRGYIFGVREWLLLIASIFLGCFCLAISLFYYRLSGKRSAKRHDQLNAGPGEIRFQEDSIIETTTKLSEAVSYHTIEYIYHRESYYFLFISKLQAVLIDTNRIAEGDPAAFRDFLLEKTGLLITEL